MEFKEYLFITLWTIFVMLYGQRLEKGKHQKMDNVLWNVVYYVVLLFVAVYYVYGTLNL
jgi:hypothetical protein